MKIAKQLALLSAIMAMLTGLGPGFAVKNGIAAEGEVVVFAAASTTNAITEIGGLFAARGLGRITTSFAASSTLAKQIANGAPANVFLSANEKWMDFLEEKDVVEKASRFDLLGNRIVLIAPLQSMIQTVDVKQGMDLALLLGKDGRLSIGDPEHVPAGIYGKTAIEYLGLWDQVKDRLAPMKDVRAALVMVARAETPMGLVYATDAAISEKVRIVGTFPKESHPPIVYPVAPVSAGRGVPIRVRISARHVAVALQPPSGTSFQNIFPGTVDQIIDHGKSYVDLRLNVGCHLWARITRQSFLDLTLKPGQPVFALIKSVSVSTGTVADNVFEGRDRTTGERK